MKKKKENVVKKEKFCVKGIVIATILSRKEKEFVKRLRDSLRLRESLNPTVKGIPTERPKTTTSCGLNPTVKGIPTERPETTTSCGLNPTVKGIPTERPETTTSCGLIPPSKGFLLKRLETTISCSLSFHHDN
jgi:hypothetical protein